jgi:hypothetical protein
MHSVALKAGQLFKATYIYKTFHELEQQQFATFFK